jgi:hypothetical protein
MMNLTTLFVTRTRFSEVHRAIRLESFRSTADVSFRSMISTPSVVLEPISVHIIVHWVCVKTVSTVPTANIASLKVLFPDCDTDFVFHGQLLNGKRTFDFYQLRSNDSIVAIPAKADPKITEPWITITRDDDTFSDSIRMLVNPKAKSESMRLRDLRATRLENRPRVFRKFCHEGLKLRPESEARSPDSQIVIPKEAKDISNESLPICW